MTIYGSGSRSARRRLSLDGIWQFQHERGPWRETAVPSAWQAQFRDLTDSTGHAIYRRRFTRPALHDGQELALCFGAVSYFCTVVLNGATLGSHEGAYLPFELLLPPDLLRDQNEIEVHVTLPSADRAAFPDYPFDEIPHGKQSWYGAVGGIWQSVALEIRDPRRLVSAVIDAGADRTLRAHLRFSPAARQLPAVVQIVDADGAIHASTTLTAADDVALTLYVPGAQLWDIGAPHLYRLVVNLADGVDIVEERFGFRSVTTSEGRILLNGRAILMRAALDQDYYADSLYTTPATAFLEDQARKAIALGLNTLRCHIKVPDPRYYDVADRFGLLVWTEVPNVASFTAQSARRMRDTLAGLVARDRNHPSIIAWTIINEDWGTRLVENAAHRAWLKESYDWLKALDPTRLVVDNSPCFPNFHVRSDINDFHYYRSVPERRQEWNDLTAQFATGADWTYSPFGDAERRGDEPLIVSEFGVWGLPDPALLRSADGTEPAWFESGDRWGDGAAVPHGMEERFAALGLGRVFGGFTRFIEAVQWYQFMNLRYQIEQIRLHPQIVGYVITELTDLHWEANGLLDMRRNPRVFHDVFGTINADIVIVPRPARYAAYAGSTLAIDLTIATGGASLPAGTTLSWSGDASGSIEVPATGPLATAPFGSLTMQLPPSDISRMARIDFTLKSGDQLLASNSCDIALYAARRVPNVTIFAEDAGIAAYLAGLGYRSAPEGAADLIVVRTLDARAIAAIEAGARYLVLADGRQPAPGLRSDLTSAGPAHLDAIELDGRQMRISSDHALPNLRLIERDGTMWRGDWIAGFSWVDRSGAFADIPGGPLFDLSFTSVVPHYLLDGFRPWEVNNTVNRMHAGIVVGWAHKPAAIVIEKHIGAGSLVASTFRLMNEAPGADPVAAALFDALIRTACAAAPAAS
ncbi:MAG: glycoside hydrolase family 2 [Hyphomicrobiales bacterium]|nr:MAG: glycoside hydrolase family 2 [Hyphomicrobiales bacterium]